MSKAQTFKITFNGDCSAELELKLMQAYVSAKSFDILGANYRVIAHNFFDGASPSCDFTLQAVQ